MFFSMYWEISGWRLFFFLDEWDDYFYDTLAWRLWIMIKNWFDEVFHAKGSEDGGRKKNINWYLPVLLAVYILSVHIMQYVIADIAIALFIASLLWYIRFILFLSFFGIGFFKSYYKKDSASKMRRYALDCFPFLHSRTKKLVKTGK